jgi:DNA modification methylase
LSAKFVIENTDACRGMSEFLEPSSVDLVWTDPPYNLRSSANIGFGGRRKDISTDFGEWDNQTSENFMELHKKWIPIVAKKMKVGASMYLCCADVYMSHIIEECVKAGLHYRCFFVWAKSNPGMQVRKVQYRSSCELILFLTKDGDNGKAMHVFNWPSGSVPLSYVITSICQGPERTGHPTQKKLDLVRLHVSVSGVSGGTLLDPFCGSGTSLVAGMEAGMSVYGFDTEAKWVETARNRVRGSVGIS